MDDARRQVLLAELEDAKRERDNLDAFIQVLSIRLGIDPPGSENGSAGGHSSPQPTPALLAEDPLTLVFNGEFVGKSWPKATAEVLRRYSPEPYHRPVKTPVLVDALKKGGLDVKTARQLYRSLYNSSQFTALPGGMWGFAAWYPERVKNKGPKPSITDEEVDSVVDEALSDSVEDDGMAEEEGAS